MNPFRILIVDANPQAGASLRVQLRELGFEVAETVAVDGALSLAASFKPAVVLLDLSAPGCDGATFVADLRAIGSNASVVVVSGEAEAEAAAALAALGAGADGYLLRPLQADRLRAAVERASERRALRLEISGLRERVRGRLALIGASP